VLTHLRCAVGAAFETRFHPAFVTFPKSLVELFADRTRKYLELELDNPSVATLQAISILTCHEVGNGNRGRGWPHSGKAWHIRHDITAADVISGTSVRLAFDLALHLNTSTNVLLGQITTFEANMRRNLFWAIYTADQ
jgi:hypothetical protein